MISFEMEDLIGVLTGLTPYFIAIGAALVLALIVTTAQTSTATPTNSINFIYKNYTRTILLRFPKQLPHPGCANTYVHFNKI